MLRRDPIEVLQDDVTIPKIVQKSADEAFRKIQGEHKKVSKFSKKKVGLLIAAAMMVFGTITVAAAYLNWSKSLSEGLQATEKQKTEMEETNMSTFVDQVSEDQGIRITAVQSITDNYYTHLAFKVEGYQLEEGEEPAFETIDVTVDGKNDFSAGGSFYNGIIQGNDGKLKNADGTEVDYDEQGGLIEHYTMNDGTLEFQYTLADSERKDSFINKPIHVELHNLGTVHNSEYTNKINGTWTFDWNLEGSAKIKESTVNVPLGDSKATVIKMELSPISIHANYKFPRKKISTSAAVGENGEELSLEEYAEPPALTGIKMKDGTIYPYTYLGPGTSGYESEDSDIYRISFAVDRIIDVEQVESLLFQKSYPENDEPVTEENFYTVPL